MFGMGKKIEVSEIIKEIEAGQALLVDVRRDDEWRNGHAEDAVHLPVERLMQGELPTDDKKIKVYLYCASGNRAGRAAEFLKNQGFEAENLGGLTDWKTAGGETE